MHGCICGVSLYIASGLNYGQADVAAVIAQEGLAFLCLISGSLTLTRAKIELPFPKKRGAAAAGREKVIN